MNSGGGGRVAIEYATSTFLGSVSVANGSVGTQFGTYFSCSSPYIGACSSRYNGINLGTNFTISSGVINNSLNITRKIINFSMASIKWNDTSTNLSNVAVYNVTGLVANNPGYYLYIDNVLNQSMTTDSGGNLPLFNLTLSSTRTIEILDALPNVAFTGQTPASGSYQNYTSIFVNVSSNDTNEHYVVNDFDGSLVGWWRLEQGNGTFFVDDSKYGNNGSCSGTTCPTYNSSGKFGGSMGFDGSEDYNNLGSSLPATDFTSTPFSFFVWVYPLSTSAGVVYDNRYSYSGSDNGWLWGLNSNGRLSLDLNNLTNDNAGLYNSSKYKALSINS